MNGSVPCKQHRSPSHWPIPIRALCCAIFEFVPHCEVKLPPPHLATARADRQSGRSLLYRFFVFLHFR